MLDGINAYNAKQFVEKDVQVRSMLARQAETEFKLQQATRSMELMRDNRTRCINEIKREASKLKKHTT